MILLLFVIFFNSFPCVEASQPNTYYAKVLFEQVYLYKTPVEDNSINNLYFELPKTYFVELLNKSGDFYYARYLNFKGYVKKDSVQAVSNTPTNPFLTNINFRVYAELSQKLYSLPSTQNSTLIQNIPHLTKNITYLGKLNGECLIQGRTNIWYFCKYTLDKDYYGYVYSDFCDEMNEINQNNEEVTFIANPTFEKNVEPTKTIPITSNYVSIIIGLISIPALIFIFLILKGTKILNKENLKGKEIIDY